MSKKDEEMMFFPEVNSFSVDLVRLAYEYGSRSYVRNTRSLYRFPRGQQYEPNY